MADNGNTAKEKKPGFFQGVKREWRKIIWTKKEDLAKQTALVVVISLIMGIIITLVDSGALKVINWLLSL
jgi:preprotein translocase subunit SecE